MSDFTFPSCESDVIISPLIVRIQSGADCSPHVHTATVNRNLAALECLRMTGHSMTAPDAEGRGPLALAAAHGHLDVVQYLCEYCDASLLGRKPGCRAMHLAARNGHLAVVIYLHRVCGIDVDCLHKGATVMATAAKRKQLAVVTYLMMNGARAVDYVHVGAARSMAMMLHHAGLLLHSSLAVDAVEAGSLADLVVAMEMGLDITKRCAMSDDNDDKSPGNTPIGLAAVLGPVATVILLVLRGADPTDADERRHSGARSPLQRACESGERGSGIAEFLHSIGCDILEVDCNGRTTLFLAAKNGNVELLWYLYTCGVGIDQADDEGWTPINIACYFGHADVVRCLIGLGAAHTATINGLWPVTTAASMRREEILRLLYANGADIGTAVDTTSRGMPVLHSAVVVRDLCEQHARRMAGFAAVAHEVGIPTELVQCVEGVFGTRAYIEYPTLAGLLTSRGTTMRGKTTTLPLLNTKIFQ